MAGRESSAARRYSTPPLARRIALAMSNPAATASATVTNSTTKNVGRSRSAIRRVGTDGGRSGTGLELIPLELPAWTHSLTPPETSVHLRSLAHTRAPEQVKQSRPLILCGRCGADRVIPLTFTPTRRDDRHQGGWPDTPERPLFKCLECRSHLGRAGMATRRTPQGPTSSAMLASRAPGPAVREVGPSG